MPFFTRPLWLIAIPFCCYLLWRLQQSSLVEGSNLRRWFWLFLRSSMLIALFFALAGFNWETKVRQNEILFMLDVSDSITAEQRRAEIASMNRVIQKIHSPDKVGVILLGSDAAVDRFPADPFPVGAAEAEVDGSGTNLENAARLASAMYASNFKKHLVVLSDGQDNQGNADREFRLLQDEGVSLQALYFPPPERVEAGIERIAFPDKLRLKEPFDLEVVTSSNRSMPGVIQIFQSGQLIQEATVFLRAQAKNIFRFPQKIETAGLYRYEVRLKPERDFLSGNNSQQGWVSVEGPPSILLVDSEPEQLRPLQTMLSKRGFQADLKAIENFPYSLDALLAYQAIVFRNVPAARVHDQMGTLKDYVHDFGGGFAMIGGERSFGPGGYYRTPVETLLPVKMDLTNKKYLADVAMVIVIDKSGSMSFADRGKQKIDLADEGAARVASFLKKSDQLGVLAVDSVPKWVFSLQKLTDQEEAIEEITSIRAGGGGIYVFSGLHEAYAELRKKKSPVKHVILFADTADCEEKDGPSGESSLSLAEQALRDDRITTTTIGIGQSGDIDVDFLRQVAGIGEGRFYFTSDMFTLPEIFAQESSIVQRYYITEESFVPRIVQQEPLMSGIDAVPALHGYVATSAKRFATTNLLSHREDPILACWQFGLGRSIAFTSDPVTAWSSDWNRWSEVERFWSQIAHFLTQSGGQPHFRSSFTAEKGVTTIVLEALDDQGQYINDAEFTGVFVDSAGSHYRIEFEQTAPGRYEARVRTKGSAIGKILRTENGTVSEESIVQLPESQSREFETDKNGRARLIALVGKVADSPDQIQFSRKSTWELRSLQNELILFAAFLFLIDVAVRKIEWRRLRLHMKEPVTEPKIAIPQIAQLKERKRSVDRLRRQSSVSDFDRSTSLAAEMPTLQTEEEEKQTNSEYIERLKEAKRRKGARE